MLGSLIIGRVQLLDSRLLKGQIHCLLASEVIAVLMGNKVGPRKEMILRESSKIESIEELDI